MNSCPLKWFSPRTTQSLPDSWVLPSSLQFPPTQTLKTGRKISEPLNENTESKEEPLYWTENALLDKSTLLAECTCRCLLCKFWEFSHWCHLAEWKHSLERLWKTNGTKTLFFKWAMMLLKNTSHKHTAPTLSSVALFQQSNNSRGFCDFSANPGMRHWL